MSAKHRQVWKGMIFKSKLNKREEKEKQRKARRKKGGVL